MNLAFESTELDSLCLASLKYQLALITILIHFSTAVLYKYLL